MPLMPRNISPVNIADIPHLTKRARRDSRKDRSGGAKERVRASQASTHGVIDAVVAPGIKKTKKQIAENERAAAIAKVMKMGKGWGIRREPGEVNGLEREYAQMLAADPEVENFWFERMKVQLARATFWEPDFLVQKVSGELQIHEVKGGFFPEKNRIKLKTIASWFPMRVILAQKKNKKTGWRFTEF